MFSESVLCPAKHPHALNSAQNCCQRLVDSSNPDKIIDTFDPVSVCPEEETIKCPVPGHLCKSRATGE